MGIWCKFAIETAAILKVEGARGLRMDELMIEVIKKMTDKFENFLKACKAEGDTNIDDVLKRLEDLKKES